MTKCISIHCPVRASCKRSITKEFDGEEDFYRVCNENSGYPNHISINMKKNDKIVKVRLANPCK